MSNTIEIKCPACGSEKFIKPTKQELENEDAIVCAGCGRDFSRAQII